MAELSESNGYMDEVMREYEKIWNRREENKWDNMAEKKQKELRKRIEKARPLTDTESKQLLKLGREYFTKGLLHRVWDLAFFFSKGMGTISEEHTFDSSCDLIENTPFNSEVHFFTHVIQALLQQDENIKYHERLIVTYQSKISIRLSHMFLTDSQIILIGLMEPRLQGFVGFRFPVYRTNGRLWKPIYFDLIDLKKIHSVRVQGKKVRVFYECDYEHTVEKYDSYKKVKARGLKKVIVEKSGHLDLELAIEKCRPLLIPKEKPYPDRDLKNRARKLHDQLVVDTGGTTIATGTFDETSGGRLTCPFCDSTYRYPPSSVLPDGSIKCQNCMKLFKIE